MSIAVHPSGGAAARRPSTAPSPVSGGSPGNTARRPCCFQVTSRAAEASFRKGLQASRARGREREALAYFEAALILDVYHRKTYALPLYRSYYGLGLAFAIGQAGRALALCRDAADEAPYEADLFLNLGRVELRAGNRRAARRAFRRGLHLADDKAPFRRYLERVGPRAARLVPFTHGAFGALRSG